MYCTSQRCTYLPGLLVLCCVGLGRRTPNRQSDATIIAQTHYRRWRALPPGTFQGSFMKNETRRTWIFNHNLLEQFVYLLDFLCTCDLSFPILYILSYGPTVAAGLGPVASPVLGTDKGDIMVHTIELLYLFSACWGCDHVCLASACQSGGSNSRALSGAYETVTIARFLAIQECTIVLPRLFVR